ncbi:MAG TPA: hypothetical protein VGM37_05155 [Armatimonadota bacterium]|jgi:hypothetical protein
MDVQRKAAHSARRALERVTAGAVFLAPLAVNPFTLSRSGRVTEAAMWGFAALAGWFLAALWAARPGRMAIPARLARPAAFWLVAVLISVAAAFAKPLGVWGAMSLAPPIVLALSIGEAARKPAARRRIMAAWVASAGICSVYALAQRQGLNPFGRAGATPIAQGAFLAVALPLAVALSRTRRCPKWLAAAAAVIVAALALTGSPAMWAAAAAGVLVALYAATPKAGKAGASWMTLAALQGVILFPAAYHFAPTLVKPLGAIAAAGIIAWVLTVPNYHRARRMLAAGAAIAAVLAAASLHRSGQAPSPPAVNAQWNVTEAGLDRQEFWQAATTLVQKRLWFGWGPDGFRAGAPTVANDHVIAPDSTAYPHANAQSEWYTAAVDGGALGLIAWVTFILSLLSVAADRARADSGRDKPSPNALPPSLRLERAALAAGVFGGLVAFALQGCLTPRSPVTTLGLALLWGLAASAEPVSIGIRRAGAHGQAMRVSAIAFGAVAAVCFLGLLSADAFSGIGDARQAAGQLPRALAWYRAAAAVDPMEPSYRADLAKCALKAAASENGIAAATAAVDAEQAYAANIAREPGNGIWHAGRAIALCYTAPSEAVAEAKRAARLSPNSAACWWAIARAQRANGHDLEEKLALQVAIACKPVDPAPWFRLAAIFTNQHEPGKARYLLTRAAADYPDSRELDAWR